MVPKRVRSARNRMALRDTSDPDLPEYLSTRNLNIHFGYRREMTLPQALQSIFMWHNETLNIWSHGIGAICFLFLLVAFGVSNGGGNKSKLPMIVFLACCVYTLSVSTYFHIVLCVSKEQCAFWRKMDFIAIIILMFSMFVPFCYYIFGQTSLYWLIYVGIAGAISIGSIQIVLLPFFQKNKFNVLRPILFGLLGLWGLAPLIHAITLDRKYAFAIALVFIQLLIHGIGAAFYVSQFPERIYRNAANYNSHFIFHVFVVIGLLVFYASSMILYLN